MKYIRLEAKNAAGQLLGVDEHFPIAETIEDVLEMENLDNGWNASEIVACFNYGSRVKRQVQLRGGSTMTEEDKAFRALSPEQKKAALEAIKKLHSA
jgi:hypothetical protein